MPGKHSKQQKRQAAHVEKIERARGFSKKRAKKIAWATVGKQQQKSKERSMPPKKGKVPPQLKKYLFKKGHHAMAKKKKHHKSTSTALVHHRASAPIVKYKTRKVYVTKYKTRHVGGAAHDGGAIAEWENHHGFSHHEGFDLSDWRSPGIAGLIGYSKAGKGFAALNDMIQKLPTFGKAPPEAIAALIAYWFRGKGDLIADAATALMHVSLYEIGQAGFSISGDDD